MSCNISKTTIYEKAMWVCRGFLLLAILTSSFDQWLVIDISGQTLRVAQVCIAFGALVWGGTHLIARKLPKWPVGGQFLVVLVVLNALFCITNGLRLHDIGYEIWFLLDVLMVFMLLDVFDSFNRRKLLFRVYLISFAGSCVFAILQLLIGMLGGSLGTDQWTKAFLPRLNGFNSEPSYFACFLIPCWILLAWLIEKNEDKLITPKWLWLLFGLITFALVFSTSRMAWLFIILWFAFRFVAVIRKSSNKERISFFCVVLLTAGMMTATIALTAWKNPLSQEKSDNAAILALQKSSGMSYDVEKTRNQDISYLDRYATFAGSDTPRIMGMIFAGRVFTQSPFVGKSLGGVEMACVKVSKEVGFNGIYCVSGLGVEVAAALGVGGLVLFALYGWSIVKPMWRWRRERESMYLLGQGLFWGTIWQIGLLQFNNNILRIYVWVQLAILTVAMDEICSYEEKNNE